MSSDFLGVTLQTYFPRRADKLLTAKAKQPSLFTKGVYKKGGKEMSN